MKQLCNNAIIEKRFSDASKYYWQLAMESREDTSSNKASSVADLINISEIYYTYDIIYWNVDKPFARALPTTVFQVNRMFFYMFLKYKQAYNLLYSAIFWSVGSKILIVQAPNSRSANSRRSINAYNTVCYCNIRSATWSIQVGKICTQQTSELSLAQALDRRNRVVHINDSNKAIRRR